MAWKIFVDHQKWSGHKRLFLVRGGDWRSPRAFVLPFSMQTAEPGAPYDAPTLEETYEEARDGVGDVDGFLQAALDAAWELGMRPTGFADHTNELKATRAHLEDMRTLALKEK